MTKIVTADSDPFEIEVKDPCQPWDCKITEFEASDNSNINSIYVRIAKTTGITVVPFWTNTVHEHCYPDW
jgi:hypothetical protein